MTRTQTKKEMGKAEDYVEHHCQSCGDLIGYAEQDHSLLNWLCETCFSEVFPDND